MPETGKSFTADEARAIGQELGIDWATSPFDVEQLRIGMKVELEHGLHDPRTDVRPACHRKIALAHLRPPRP